MVMQIKEKIENWVRETLKIEGEVLLVHPKFLDQGDFALVVSPQNIFDYTEALKNNLITEVGGVEAVSPRFINIHLSKQFFADSIEQINKEKENFGKTNLLEDQNIIVEHTQPNPFKEFHIGHLMNNAIGESVARILRANGAYTKSVSYHGDVGLHVAKTIWAIMHSDFFVSEFVGDFGRAYSLGNKAYEEDEEARKQIIEINKKIYDRSYEEVNSIYDKGKVVSLEYFESIYKRLGSHFDEKFFESQSGEVGKQIVLENVGKVFEEGEAGAIIFKGENFEPKTHTRVFVNKEGLPTYEAKEVGLAKIKKDKWAYNRSITITANEQDAFFKVVEVAVGEVFSELKGKLHHLSHGMLKLTSGKMSSRTGDVITAESLIEQVKEKIKEKIAGRELTEEQKENIAEVVAIGAIKYSILRQAVGGDIIFDFEKSISFEGDSGPYLQYAYVRARSVLEKANSQGETLGALKDSPWETAEVEKLLYRFPEVVEKSAKDYSPHHLVTYLTEIAAAFNAFYAREKIVDDIDPTSPYKISITKAVSVIMQNGLNLLGIKTVERM